jgi:DNA-directed RNA polymerase subunit H (RpoH/RPB5)
MASKSNSSPSTVSPVNPINPELIPIRKDSEMVRKEILTNLIKMFIERKYILQENFNKNLKKIEKPSDTETYELSLDKEMQPDSTDEKFISKFDGKILRIKIIHQKIIGISKSPLIKEFLDQNTTNHKIFIFDGISDKVKTTLTSIPNTEIFVESFLMINIVEHIDSPKYEVLTEEEGKQVLETYIVKKKELPKILTTDPIVTYFNLKRGQIIRIIRCSEQSGFSVIYRIVAKGGS